MTIAEFAKSRGIEQQAVSRYLIRHGLSYNRNKGLTAEQMELLDQKYPLPSPVQLIEDTESRKALIEAQAKIISLQEELSGWKEKAMLVQASELKISMLEDKTSQQKEQIQQLIQTTSEQEQTIKNKDAEISALKHRTLWERILNK